MKLTAKEKDFVECLRVARVATVSDNGVPHNVPLCPLVERHERYFATERGGRNLRNIEGNPHVTMVFDEYSEAWDSLRGVMIQGKARIVNKAEFRQVRKKFYTKYPQYQSNAPIGDRDSVIVELKP